MEQPNMDIRRRSVPTTPVVVPSALEPATPGSQPPPPRKKRSVQFLQRHWLTVAFILGFIIDNLTLNRVDQFFDNFILSAYIVLAMVSTLLLYAAAAEKLPEPIVPHLRKIAPFSMQYAFGGLLSGMLIFYGRSGAWDASWPYLAIILLAIYGNETIKDRATRLIYNLTILFIGLFSYVVLVIPVLTGLMGPWIFVGSGFLALIIMYGFVRVLYRIIPHFMELQMRAIVFTLGVVFTSFNFFYFANIIPPIPLSLKDMGIYHSVVRFENGTYQVTYEAGPWWQPWKDSDATIHPIAGESVFCYAQVFAPTKLSASIFHVWEYKDSATGQWVEHAKLAYPISGGRGDGYRGYTLINAYQNGTWRCSVETARGQVLGREIFTIDTSHTAKNVVTELR